MRTYSPGASGEAGTTRSQPSGMASTLAQTVEGRHSPLTGVSDGVGWVKWREVSSTVAARRSQREWVLKWPASRLFSVRSEVWMKKTGVEACSTLGECGPASVPDVAEGVPASVAW